MTDWKALRRWECSDSSSAASSTTTGIRSALSNKLQVEGHVFLPTLSEIIIEDGANTCQEQLGNIIYHVASGLACD